MISQPAPKKGSNDVSLYFVASTAAGRMEAISMRAEDQARAALRESMRLNGDIRKKGESMSAQKIINGLMALILAVFGWMGNTVWSIVQTQQQQLTLLNIELAKNYMPRIELQQQLDRMTTQLERIDQQTRRP